MERRTVAGTPYQALLTAPRAVAEGLKARLEARGIPVVLATPFEGLPESALGTYMGDVSLLVPEALWGEAEAVLEGEIP